MGYVDIHIIYIFCRYTLTKFKTLSKSLMYVLLTLLVVGCRNKQERNIEFMPDMYESPAYKTYEVAPRSPP